MTTPPDTAPPDPAHRRTRIQSDQLVAEVANTGAELQSLNSTDGRAWLWHGDPAWWTGRSPLLFPIVGAAPHDMVLVDGQRFPMQKHGFARRSVFELVDHSASFCRHRLCDSEATRARYPFAFELTLEHRIDGHTLTLTATVTNRDTRPMPYGLGFHPAFVWPLPGAAENPHRIHLANGAQPALSRLRDGLLRRDTLDSPFADGGLTLDATQFVDDAMIFLQGAGRSLRYGPDNGPHLDFRFDNLPALGIWQKPRAPYICIEPWHGAAAFADDAGDIRSRPLTITVAAGESRTHTMAITITDGAKAS